MYLYLNAYKTLNIIFLINLILEITNLFYLYVAFIDEEDNTL